MKMMCLFFFIVIYYIFNYRPKNSVKNENIDLQDRIWIMCSQNNHTFTRSQSYDFNQMSHINSAKWIQNTENERNLFLRGTCNSVTSEIGITGPKISVI
jgi:hypothetical protein